MTKLIKFLISFKKEQICEFLQGYLNALPECTKCAQCNLFLQVDCL